MNAFSTFDLVDVRAGRRPALGVPSSSIAVSPTHERGSRGFLAAGVAVAVLTALSLWPTTLLVGAAALLVLVALTVSFGLWVQNNVR